MLSSDRWLGLESRKGWLFRALSARARKQVWHMDREEIHRLVHAFRTYNDHDSFHRLYGYYEKRVWILIHSRGVPEPNAGDVFQETCLGLAKYLSRNSRPPDNLLAVVTTIAKRKIADYFRRGGEPTVSLFDIEKEGALPHDRSNPARTLESREELRQLVRESGMNENQRHALVLFYLMGYTHKEIAEIMLVPPETVKSRIYHGKRAIMAYLQEVGK